MEKFIFLATVKDRLTEMNLSQESINKHVKIFEDCFKGKNADEVDSVIQSAGGIEGILKSIYNLEVAKQKNNTGVISIITEKNTSETDEITEAAKESAENTSSPLKSEASDTPKDDFLAETDVAFSEETNTEKASEQNDNDSPTMEIPKAPNIDQHIREAEEMSETLERIPVVDVNNNEEYSAELSDYDFEMLFEEKLSKTEAVIKNLREKMTDKTYKATLPIAIIATTLIFAFVSALFPVLIATAVLFSVAYICILVAGVCFALVPIGYGIYMCFKSMPIALYELGIGIISSGVTMLLSILLYNYVKRLVPYLIKQLIKLFKFCIKLTKKYFGKQAKEEA